MMFGIGYDSVRVDTKTREEEYSNLAGLNCGHVGDIFISLSKAF